MIDYPRPILDKIYFWLGFAFTHYVNHYAMTASNISVASSSQKNIECFFVYGLMPVCANKWCSSMSDTCPNGIRYWYIWSWYNLNIIECLFRPPFVICWKLMCALSSLLEAFFICHFHIHLFSINLSILLNDLIYNFRRVYIRNYCIQNLNLDVEIDKIVSYIGLPGLIRCLASLHVVLWAMLLNLWNKIC